MSARDLPAVIEHLTVELLGNHIAGSRFSRKLALVDYVSEDAEFVAELIARSWERLSPEDQDLLRARVSRFVSDCPDVVDAAQFETRFDRSDA